MKFILAQLNPLIGDLKGNSKKIIEACKQGLAENAEIVLTPELSLWGYPPRDLLFDKSLLKQQYQILEELVTFLLKKKSNLSLLVGIAEVAKDNYLPNLFNAIAMVNSSGWEVVARKQLLPTYDVFDEKRYFRGADSPGIISLHIKDKLWKLGITICEDLWVEETIQGQRIIGPNPIEKIASEQLDILINLSASPFSHSKKTIRHQLGQDAISKTNCPLIYLNQVGGNDELIFDGNSFILNSNKEIIHTLPRCKENIGFWDSHSANSSYISPINNPLEELADVLTLGVKDYAQKCGFKSAVLGLSGGIDSALVAIFAIAALGSENVTAALMPSPWNSLNSTQDALDIANRLLLKKEVIPIENLMDAFDSSLCIPFGQKTKGITAENLQSRIRGTILMAIANEKNHLLLSTGNKSELAVGYCTLYGDMNGGLSVIGDLYKTTIFKLCEWLDSDDSLKYRKKNRLPLLGPLIGSSILNKAPSAELRPNQLDTDSLPDYSILDPILQYLIEGQSNCKITNCIEENKDLLPQVQHLIKKAEFKRRQAPPLLKVSDQAFGSGWRKPIAAS